MAKTNPKRKGHPDLDTLLNQIRTGNTPQPQQPQQPQQKAKPSGAFSSPLVRPSQNNNCCNCCDDMLGMLSIINDSATKIVNALKAEHLLDKKTAERFKKEQEEKERREKENLLESSGRKLSSSMRRAMAPLKNIMDSIIRFILFTLAGRAIGKILKWFSDPANERKVKSLTRFLKDWWPAILGAFVLFGTRFGAAIRATVRMAVSTILYLKKIGIPGIIAGLKKFGKFGLVAGGIAGTALIANKLLNPDKEEEESSDTLNAPKEQNTKIPPTPKMAGGGMVPRLNLLFPEEKHVSEISYAEGGAIDTASGISITGAGPDTQLIAAQPGEIVISKAAVNKFGADTFLRMNLMAGATNKPKFADNIQLAQQGGMIGKTMPNPSTQNFNIGSPKLSFPTNSSVSQRSQGSKISLSFPSFNNSKIQHRHRAAQVNYNSPNSSSKINFGNYSKGNLKYSSNNTQGSTNSRYNFISPNIGRASQSSSRESFMQMARYGSPRNVQNNSQRLPTTYNLKSEEPQVTFSVKAQLAPTAEKMKAPGPRPQNTVTVSELPAIDLRTNAVAKNPQAQSEVPEFSAIPRYSDRYGDNGTLVIYGIEL